MSLITSDLVIFKGKKLHVQEGVNSDENTCFCVGKHSSYK